MSRDVFPRHNLPPESAPWAREMEARVYRLQDQRDATRMDLGGQNRSTAANLSTIAKQVDEQAALVEEIDRLYGLIPKVTQRTATATDFGLSTGWNTVLSATAPVPEGANRVSVTATASSRLIGSGEGLVKVDGRLVLGSEASPTIVGDFIWAQEGEFHSSLNPSFAWELPATPGEELTVQLQVSPASGTIWPSGSGSYAALSAFLVFTTVA